MTSPCCRPTDSPASRALQCGRRMFLAALILASKWLQDRNYSARAWSKISGLQVSEINDNERAFLAAVNWKLHHHRALPGVERRQPAPRPPPPKPPSLGGNVGSRAYAEKVCRVQDADRGLTPELDNLDVLVTMDVQEGHGLLSPPASQTVAEDVAATSAPGRLRGGRWSLSSWNPSRRRPAVPGVTSCRPGDSFHRRGGLLSETGSSGLGTPAAPRAACLLGRTRRRRRLPSTPSAARPEGGAALSPPPSSLGDPAVPLEPRPDAAVLAGHARSCRRPHRRSRWSRTASSKSRSSSISSASLLQTAPASQLARFAVDGENPDVAAAEAAPTRPRRAPLRVRFQGQPTMMAPGPATAAAGCRRRRRHPRSRG